LIWETLAVETLSSLATSCSLLSNSAIIYRTMAKCYVCGKTTKVGRSVTFSGERNPRLFKANLHRVKAVLEDGTVKRIYVCTKCLKAGKVVKAVRFS